MNYQEIINIIENKRRFGNLPGVVICEKLLAEVGNPQKDLPCIHIAGTNGKGSTAAFLREICKEAGIKAGVFTSPHLIDFTERIQINGTRIPEEDVVRLGERLLALELDIHPTMFDYCLAMAMLYFKEQSCQLVILETGLGGRLDSTNVIDAPLVSIITKIGYDHTNVLGETLAEIAAEKAGILKKGTRAIIESQEASALNVITEKCQELEISYKVIDAGKILPVENGFSYPMESSYTRQPETSYTPTMPGVHRSETSYTLTMLGTHQRENALAAILAARELIELGYPITEENLHQGIAKATWNGRMELISRYPYLLIDGAHNGHGVDALVKSLKELYPDEKFHFIMGVLADKDYKKMAEQILPIAAKVTTVTPESSRALQAEELAEYIREFGVEAQSAENLEEVFGRFLTQEIGEDSGRKTVVFGSLYFIGEIRKLFQLDI